MIIFNLDNVLADCSHRMHFIKEPPILIQNPEFKKDPLVSAVTTNPDWRNFEPDYKSFYDACDKDEPIHSVIEIINIIFRSLISKDKENISLKIWSNRCESVREKTLAWLYQKGIPLVELKMRPIGDDSPIEALKERWLEEVIRNDQNTYDIAGYAPGSRPYPIDFVFDAHPASIKMFRKRGIFVFDCNQER